MQSASNTSHFAHLLLFVTLLHFEGSHATNAADVYKADNTTQIAQAGSWVGGVLPTSSDTIVFGDTFAQTGSFGTGAPLTYYGLRVEGTLTTLITINNTAVANYVALGAGGINLSTGARSLNIVGLKVDADQTWNLGANSLTVGSARLQGASVVTVIGSGELNVGASNLLTKGFDVTGVRVNASTATSLGATASVVQTIRATGQAYLTAGGTYANSFNLAGSGWAGDSTSLGALRLANAATITGNVNLIGDTLITAYQSNGTLAGNITESGGSHALQIGIAGDTGIVTLSGTLNVSGGVTLRGGTLRFGANNVFADTGALTISDAILDLAGYSDTLGSLTLTAGSIVNSASAAVLSAANIEVQSGSISATLGGGKLTKSTNGTVTLTAVQTYTGGTQIDSGILALDGADLLAANGAVQINGGTLDIAGHANHVGAVTLASGSIINSGTAAALTATSYEVQSGQVDAVLAGAGVNLVKNTTGTVWLNAANTYSGLTTINAGTLNVATSHSGGGGFTVASNAVLGVALSTQGGSLVAGSLTLDGGTLAVDLGAFSNPGAGSPVLDIGIFSVNSLSSIDLSGFALSLGQFSLLSYDTFNGSFADLLLGSLPARTLAVLVNNTSAKTIDLNITGVDVPKWTGLGGSAWDINSTQNWKLVSAGTTTTYLEGGTGTDSVLFEDSATTTVVDLTTTLSPISITVNNSTKLYAFTGSGRLSGTSSLTKNGTGTLVLANTGSNDFSGGLVINSGAVQLGDGTTTGVGQPGAGPVSIASLGRLEFFLAAGQNLTLGNVIQGAGTIVQKGNNVVTLSGGNSNFSGAILITNGTLKAGYDNAFGTASVEVQQNGTLDITGYEIDNNILLGGGVITTTSGLANALNGSVTLSNGGFFNVASSAQLVLQGVLSGNGGFNKQGAGLLLLTAENLFSGITTLDQGVLRIGHSGALGATGIANRTVVKSAATLDLAGNTVDETIDLQGGRLTNSTGSAAVSAGVTLSNAAVVDASANASIALLGPVDGSGGLVKTGVGTLRLSGINSYSGGTSVNEGTVVFENAAALPATGLITVASGTVVGFGFSVDQALLDAHLGASANAFTLALGTSTSSNLNLTNYTNVALGALSSITYSGNLTIGSATYLFGGGSGELTIASNLSGAHGVTIGAGGTVILTGNNSHVGANTISSGLLRLGSNTALGSTTNALVLQSTAGSTTTLDLNGYDVVVGGLTAPQNPAGLVQITDNSTAAGITRLTANIASGSTTFGSWIRDGANGRQLALVKTGAGTLVLSGATNTVGGHTFSGGLYINQGTLDVRVNQAQALPSYTDIYFTGTSTLLASNNGGAAVVASTSVNSVHFQGGLGTITHLKANNSTSSLLNFNGTVTRNLGAAGNFAFSAVTATDSFRYSFSDFTLPADVLLDSGIYINGDSYAVIDFYTGFLRGLDYIGDSSLGDTTPDTNTANAVLTADATTLTNAAGGSVSGKDLQLTGTGNITGQTSETLSTLKIAANNNLVLANGATLTVQSLLKAGGSAAEISGGSGLTLDAADTRDFVIRTDLATDVLTISSNILPGVQNGLTKSGLGTLILAGNNQYSGITHLLDGSLKLASVNALGAGGFLNRTRVHSTAFLDIGGLAVSEIVELYNNGAVGTSVGTTGTLTGDIILTGGGQFQVAAGAVLQVNSIISGSGTLGNSGVGQTILTGANTFTGDVAVTNGTLVVTGNQSFGVGVKTISVANANRPGIVLDGSGGNLTLGANFTWNISSDGAAGYTTLGAIVNRAGTNTIEGAIHITNGGGGQGKLYVQAGRLVINGNIDSAGATSARTLLLDGPGTGEINGVISDASGQAVSVTKSGTGTWTLDGSNTFTGSVTISEGVLQASVILDAGTAQSLGASASSSAITLGAATTTGILEYTGITAATLPRNITVGGVGGGVVRNSSGQLLTLSGILTHNGRPLTFNLGEFAITGAINGANASSNTIVDQATVTFYNSTSTYNGDTIVRGGGILKNGADNVLPNGTTIVLGEATGNTGGTYDLNGFSETVAGLAQAGTGPAVVTNSAASGTSTLEVTGTSTFGGVITDGLNGALTALTKSTGGILTLTGQNLYTGLTSITGGTLAIASSGGIHSHVAIGSGAVLDTLGSIHGNVSVGAGGDLHIGAGGVTGLAVIQGTLTLSSTSDLFFDIGGTARGAGISGYDAINGLEGIILGGVINVSFVNGFVAEDGQHFNLIDWTGLLAEGGGTVADLGYTFNFNNASVTSQGLVWMTDLFSTTGDIYLAAVPEPGRGLLIFAGLGGLFLRRRRSLH